MTEILGTETSFEGRAGTAVLVPMPADVPLASEEVATWLLTAPGAYPLWDQYWMAVIRLRDVPGIPPPHLHFPGATHELILYALDPADGPYTPGNLSRYTSGPQAGKLPILTPHNISHQLEGTDDEARLVAAYAAWGVAYGVLWPETDGAQGGVRAAWKGSLVKTLAHIRGEAHTP